MKIFHSLFLSWMMSRFKQKKGGLGGLVVLWGGEPWLPIVLECALADIFCAETYLPLCLAVELPYWSPVLNSSSAELEVLPFGLDTSASESLTTSSPSSWPGNPIPPPNVGFPFPHKLTLNQDPCHRETERLRKVSFRNFLSSLSR